MKDLYMKTPRAVVKSENRKLFFNPNSPL